MSPDRAAYGVVVETANASARVMLVAPVPEHVVRAAYLKAEEHPWHGLDLYRLAPWIATFGRDNAWVEVG